jgi:hypothetical protein
MHGSGFNPDEQEFLQDQKARTQTNDYIKS